MPRTNIPVQKVKSHELKLNATETAGDLANGNSFKNTGRESLNGRNDGAGAVEITIKAVADNLRRVVDVVLSVPAGGKFNCLSIPTYGFNQPDGTVNIDVDVNADLKLWVLKQEG